MNSFETGTAHRCLSKSAARKQKKFGYRRLSLKREFDYVRNAGSKEAGRYMLIVAADAEELGCSAVVSKKYSLLAVKRNRARRLLHEAFRQLSGRVKPSYMILVPRRYMYDAKLDDVSSEMARLLKKMSLLLEKGDE